MHTICDETEEDFKINRNTVNNLRYADDTVLIVDGAEGWLEELIVEVC